MKHDISRLIVSAALCFVMGVAHADSLDSLAQFLKSNPQHGEPTLCKW